MKTSLFFSFIFTAILLMVSCEKEELNEERTITGTGPIVNKTLALDPFTQIEHDGVADFYVTVGGEQQVILKAQQNIIDVMTWEVQSGTLMIGMEEHVTIHNHDGIRIEIVMDELHNILHDGVGNFSLQGNNSSLLDIQFTGVGNVDAYAFPVDHCTVFNNGVGDCKVMVNQTLDVDISGIGDVYYRGYPEITVSDTGPGDLINDN